MGRSDQPGRGLESFVAHGLGEGEAVGVAGAGSALGGRMTQHEHVYQLIVGRHVETGAHGLGVIGADPTAAQAKDRCSVCHVSNDNGGVDGAEIALLATHALS